MPRMTRAHLLNTLAQLADDEHRRGTVTGRASGVLVATMVLSFFLVVGLSAGMLDGTLADAAGWTALLLVPVGLSLLLSTVTTQLAIRASSTRDAVLALLLGMVCPPFTVFLVTCYGAFFAGGAGLLAFFVTLPVVLSARRAQWSDETGPHEALVGATALVVGSWVVLLAQACVLGTESAGRPVLWPLCFPPAVAALTALWLSVPIVRRSAARRRLLGAVRDREFAGVEARTSGGTVEFSSVDVLPGGPHRGGRRTTAAGGFALSGADARWARAVAGLSLAALVGATLFLFL